MRASARVVPDASIVVKWFIREKHSDAAQWLRSAFHGRLFAPSLLLNECANAGWRNIRDGKMSFAIADDMVGSLPGVITLVPPDAALARRALFIAREMNHPAYDCFYLAFAEREGTVIVTADERLLNTVKRNKAWGDFVIFLPDAAREWAGLGGDGL